jgi:hypothetical protein
VHLQLEIHRTVPDTVDGVLVTDDGRLPFSGWLDLLRLLEATVDPVPGPARPPAPLPRPPVERQS